MGPSHTDRPFVSADGTGPSQVDLLDPTAVTALIDSVKPDGEPTLSPFLHDTLSSA